MSGAVAAQVAEQGILAGLKTGALGLGTMVVAGIGLGAGNDLYANTKEWIKGGPNDEQKMKDQLYQDYLAGKEAEEYQKRQDQLNRGKQKKEPNLIPVEMNNPTYGKSELEDILEDQNDMYQDMYRFKGQGIPTPQSDGNKYLSALMIKRGMVQEDDNNDLEPVEEDDRQFIQNLFGVGKSYTALNPGRIPAPEDYAQFSKLTTTRPTIPTNMRYF